MDTGGGDSGVSLPEEQGRAAVVADVREWLGTPYLHSGRIKGAAADCTFFAEVFARLGIIPPIEIAPYAPQAALNRASSVYLQTIERFAHEVSEPKPADVVLFWAGRGFSHGGVVIDPGWPVIIHADSLLKRVTEARGDQGRLGNAKARKFYSFW